VYEQPLPVSEQAESVQALVATRIPVFPPPETRKRLADHVGARRAYVSELALEPRECFVGLDVRPR
jgi:hypothetical protein